MGVSAGVFVDSPVFVFPSSARIGVQNSDRLVHTVHVIGWLSMSAVAASDRKKVLRKSRAAIRNTVLLLGLILVFLVGAAVISSALG